LLLSGLLLLSGCSQEDTYDASDSSGTIGFRAQGGMPSLKATTSDRNHIRSFVVNAHYSKTETWDSADDYLLYGTTVYRGEGEGSWEYFPKAYFPTDGDGNQYVEFFAYAPAGSSSVSHGLGETSDKDQTIAYKVPVPVVTSGATSQEDFLVAYERVPEAGYDNAVKLQFRHALARILVAAQSDLEATVTITGLKLNNLKNEGALSLKGNTSTSTDKSNGIPAGSGSGQTTWVYESGTIDSTDDYVTLWDSSTGTLTDYPYILPASGVTVNAEEKAVTSLEQGMFVIPQTTAGDPSDAVSDGEFGLEVAYTLNGQAGKAFIQFADINGIANTGVTFEIGRQYVLRLNFSDDGSGDIDIGSSITFGDPDADPYPDPDTEVPKTVWASSNIYWVSDGTGDGSVGSLTFAESGTGKRGYQGLYFMWGSLIGVAAAANNTSITADTHLFIPDVATGKYFKVKFGDVSSNSNVSAFYAVVNRNGTWTGGVSPNIDWILIPFCRSGDYGNDRSINSIIAADTLHVPAKYTGDVCKYLSDTKGTNGAGLTGKWMIPTSNMFAGEGHQDSFPYTATDGSIWNPLTKWPPESSYDGTNENGDSKTRIALMTYMYSPTGETVYIPASGYRNLVDGKLDNIAIGYYWSSSATTSTADFTYYLNHSSSDVFPDNTSPRSNGFSIRCVKEQ
jgi:hypothetical protein